MLFPKPGPRKKKSRPGFTTPANLYCQYCGSTWGIERHHITPKGLGGSYDPAIHAPENRIDLCPVCHDRAQQYKPGYLATDLLRKKAEDEERNKVFKELIGFIQPTT